MTDSPWATHREEWLKHLAAEHRLQHVKDEELPQQAQTGRDQPALGLGLAPVHRHAGHKHRAGNASYEGVGPRELQVDDFALGDTTKTNYLG